MIKFGTDGWRARIADEFTFSNVRLAATAIVNYVKTRGEEGKPFIIGFDNRFLSEAYAAEAARVASSSGLDCYLSDSALPSPALSFKVKAMNASGGIMVTASHNPAEYNGIKFKAPYGGSASPDITAKIEEELKKIVNRNEVPQKATGESKRFNPKVGYFEALERFVDFDLIKRAGFSIVFDPMHGSGAGYLPEILKKHGIGATEINNNRDPLFGGLNPEPIPVNLDETTSVVKEASLRNPGRTVIGIVLDGDADRIGAVDQTGMFINPHHIFAVILRHLVERKRLSGEVVKTFNMTNMIGLLCEKYGLKLHETPIGFKYICDLMLTRDILIGGEESGGIGIKGHIPERDGTLNALLLLEAAAAEGRSLRQIIENIMDELHIRYYYDRIDLHLDEERKSRTLKILRETPPKSLAGMKVKEIKTLDGIKLAFEDSSWVLFRASGTEPVLRIYAEATSPELLMRVLGAGEDLTKK